MTTKDLNLSFDQGLVQPKAAQHLQSTSHGKTPGDLRPDRRLRGTKPGKKHAHNAPGAWLGFAAIGIAMANMLFLAVAGLWLSGYITLSPAAFSVSRLDIATQLETAQAELDLRISMIERQLENVQASLDTQQQLIITTYQDIDERMRQEVAAQATAPEAESSVEKPNDDIPPVEPVGEIKEWIVNLGTFQEKKAAFKVRSQLEALGYQAQIESTNIDNAMTHKVIVPNFENRDSAEIAANMLMENTELDSLSVWQVN